MRGLRTPDELLTLCAAANKTTAADHHHTDSPPLDCHRCVYGVTHSWANELRLGALDAMAAANLTSTADRACQFRCVCLP